MRDLSDFFIGANHARRVAARFDAFTWWAHSLQNGTDTPTNANVHDTTHNHLRNLIGGHPL